MRLVAGSYLSGHGGYYTGYTFWAYVSFTQVE